MSHWKSVYWSGRGTRKREEAIEGQDGEAPRVNGARAVVCNGRRRLRQRVLNREARGGGQGVRGMHWVVYPAGVFGWRWLGGRWTGEDVGHVV